MSQHFLISVVAQLGRTLSEEKMPFHRVGLANRRRRGLSAAGIIHEYRAHKDRTITVVD